MYTFHRGEAYVLSTLDAPELTRGVNQVSIL